MVIAWVPTKLLKSTVNDVVAHFCVNDVLALISYCISALLILWLNIGKIPAAFVTIFDQALNPWAAGGGAIGSALQYGVARGVFSNESGLGSAPMAHAAARTKEPVREGLVAMIGPFIDTINDMYDDRSCNYCGRSMGRWKT